MSMSKKNLAEYLRKWRLALARKLLVEDVPPIPVYVIGYAQDGDTVVRKAVSATGMITETNSTVINNNLGQILRHPYIEPLAYTAAGNAIPFNAALPEWVPIVPVVVTADGAGLPPDTQIVALQAGSTIDVMLFWKSRTISGAGEHIMRFREATAAPAACDPDWAGVVVPVAALEVWPETSLGMRIETITDAVNFGIAEGVNGDWPNNCIVTFWGFYRYT